MRHLLVVIVAGVVVGCAADDPHDPPPPAHPDVEAALAADGEARVIVSLRGTAPLDPGERRVAVAAARERVLRELPDELEVVRRYAATPAFVARVRSEDALAALLDHPDVVAVVPDRPGGGFMAETGPAVGAPAIHALGFDGTGITVAVIDSGVDLGHADLAGAVIAEQCFTRNQCAPGDTATGADAQDEHGHGTNIAGIVTGDGVVAPRGVAPGAAIVAVRVLDGQNRGFLSDWLAGLDWVVDNPQLGVDVVNMSLGTDALYSGGCDGEAPEMLAAVATLRARGVTVVASTGNAGQRSTAIPACLSNVLAVGATYDSDLDREPSSGTYQDRFGSSFGACFDADSTIDLLACFTNRGARLDLLAPGAIVIAARLGGGTAGFTGTSQATAVVSGAIALLDQCRPGLPPTEATAMLANTGTPIADPSAARTIPRIDALAAVTATCVACTTRPDGAACTDLTFCNGADQCLAGDCADHAGSPCDDGLACTTETCDEAVRSCVSTVSAGHCVIDGACHDDGAAAPTDACQICAPASSTSAWVLAPADTPCAGGRCDDAGRCVADDGGCCALGGAAPAPTALLILLVAIALLRRRSSVRAA